MLRRLIRKIENSKKERYEKNKELFENIIGYDDIKQIFKNALDSDHGLNLLLNGVAGNGKSLFLKEILRKYKDSYYIDCTTLSIAGLQGIIKRNLNLKILLLDEISRLKFNVQDELLNLLQDGELINTKDKNTFRIQLKNLKVFATCNDINRLIEPLLDRFRGNIYNLPDYTYDQLLEISLIKLKSIGISDEQLIKNIVNAVYHDLKSVQLREIINIAKIIKNKDDLDLLISTRLKYYYDETNY